MNKAARLLSLMEQDKIFLVISNPKGKGVKIIEITREELSDKKKEIKDAGLEIELETNDKKKANTKAKSIGGGQLKLKL